MLTLLLVYSFIFGMAAGVLNDINRIVRALLLGKRSGRFERLYEIKLFLVGRLSERKQSKLSQRALVVLTFLGDVALFVFIGCGIVILNYYLNKGQMRLYTITSVAAGFFLYYFTIGKVVMALAEVIVFFIRATLAIAIECLMTPIRAAARSFKKTFGALARKIGLLLAKRIMLRYNKREERRLIALSCTGFLKEEEENGG